MEFKLGDKVKLKSGGPVMTVSSVSDKGVECQWFDPKGKLHKESFAAVVLTPYKVGVYVV
ncbi:DUF2158 domain-containing protein [Stenotrophomonas sp. TEPEL]|uniref:YodC family protein n=1 Tax=Stenotrophomonas sp. TEPEL TaxID=2283801 RepID=UPI00104558CE|nr:DUF2158 domain-containing protein [Stenotrophomonas sp. TEPEL]TDB32569.1 DUF2158 domain-containing protein [Stenotrophomonas sp. TEPEL]